MVIEKLVSWTVVVRRRLGLVITVAVVAAMAIAGWGTTALGTIQGQDIVYTVAGQAYEGYVAQNPGAGDRQPTVVIIHDWNGLDSYEKRRSQMLAEQGYTAVALDLYGQGVRPRNVQESQAESNRLYQNRAAMQERLLGGVAWARQLPGVDPSRVVAIGYCFGGAAALELARTGIDLKGYVSFHGSLETPAGQDYRRTQGEILILHGAADPVAPIAEAATLAEELTAAAVPFDLELYGGVRHSFTVWGATGEASRYDLRADLRSWDSLLRFLGERLR